MKKSGIHIFTNGYDLHVFSGYCDNGNWIESTFDHYDIYINDKYKETIGIKNLQTGRSTYTELLKQWKDELADGARLYVRGTSKMTYNLHYSNEIIISVQ